MLSSLQLRTAINESKGWTAHGLVALQLNSPGYSSQGSTLVSDGCMILYVFYYRYLSFMLFFLWLCLFTYVHQQSLVSDSCTHRNPQQASGAQASTVIFFFRLPFHIVVRSPIPTEPLERTKRITFPGLSKGRLKMARAYWSYLKHSKTIINYLKITKHCFNPTIPHQNFSWDRMFTVDQATPWLWEAPNSRQSSSLTPLLGQPIEHTG